MQTRSFLTLLFMVVSFLGVAASADGQRARDGAIVVRISDGTSDHCINGSSESVWVSLRRLITQKRSGWFTRDQEVGVLLRTTVTASTQDNDRAFQFRRLPQ